MSKRASNFLKEINPKVESSNIVVGTTNNVNLSRSLSSSIDTNDINDIMDQIIRKLSIKPTIKHKCNSCGATLEMDSDRHIFLCKYCGSVYAIGTQMINDRG